MQYIYYKITSRKDKNKSYKFTAWVHNVNKFIRDLTNRTIKAELITRAEYEEYKSKKDVEN